MKSLSQNPKNSWIALGLLLSSLSFAEGVRIKDIANLRGQRTNTLMGFGLVVGLPASGDSPASVTKNRAMANMLNRMGMELKPEEAIAASVAAVAVTAELPVSARNGDKIDVKVSAIGDAKSLAGGTLLATQLKALDGKMYAIATGSIGVLTPPGPTTVANLSAAASVEREFTSNIAPEGIISYSLRQPDHTTASRVADAINARFKGFYAQALNATTINIEVPPLYSDRTTEFIADLEGVRVEVDQKAVVIINSKTGTVVMGADVQIAQVAIAHGDLSIQVGGKDKTPGQTQRVMSINGSTVGELMTSLNALGVKPTDLVAIIQAAHAAGALRAELKVL